MANFITAISKIEKNEGLYSDDKNDPGNYYPQNIKTGTFIGTMRGITPTTYKQAFGHVPTIAEMKALSQNASRAIYKQLYWDKLSLDSVKDQQFSEILFDSAVNQGTGTAIKGLQSVLGIKEDGVMGADTLKKTNNGIQPLLFNKFKAWRIDTYGKGNPIYSEAWIARVNKFQYAIGIGAILLFIGIGIALFLGYQNRKEIAQTVQKNI